MGERVDGELFYSMDGGETFRPLVEIKEIEVSDTAEEPVATLLDTAPMSSVMKTVEHTSAEWLPVVDTDNRLKGYISRQRLYTLYRKMVHDMSED